MMKPSIVQQVESWYTEHSKTFSEISSSIWLRSSESTDPLKGKVVIETETLLLVASVTFWNDGNVSALAINKHSKEEIVLDDRPLNAGDNVSDLLDEYFRQITSGPSDGVKGR